MTQKVVAMTPEPRKSQKRQSGQGVFDGHFGSRSCPEILLEIHGPRHFVARAQFSVFVKNEICKIFPFGVTIEAHLRNPHFQHFYFLSRMGLFPRENSRMTTRQLSRASGNLISFEKRPDAVNFLVDLGLQLFTEITEVREIALSK